MPRGDRTGPYGEGPRTGRGLGYCNGYRSPGFTKGRGAGRGFGRGWGRGYGRGYGRGFGFRHRSRFYDFYEEPYYPEEVVSENEYLREEIALLEEELQALKNRLEKLQGDKKVTSEKKEEE